MKDFKIDEMKVTNIQNSQEIRQETLDKVAEKQVVKGMNYVDLSSVFLHLLKDETNASVQNSPKLILDSYSSLNHSNTQVLDEKHIIFTLKVKELLTVLGSI